LCENAITIQTRKIQIQNNDIGSEPVHLVERLNSIAGLRHPIAFPLEQVFHDSTQLFFVFHQEDTGTLSPSSGGEAIRLARILQQLHFGELMVDWRRRSGHSCGRPTPGLPGLDSALAGVRCGHRLIRGNIGHPQELFQARFSGQDMTEPTAPE
jgi:hypothetical protein